MNMYKISLTLLALFFSPLVMANAFAAPFNADNNPQIVANFPTGDHGIAGEPYLHQGADVVMQAGKSGVFQQWFYGTTAESGVTTEGDHSVWKPLNGDACPAGTTTVTSANTLWGSYLDPGTYCVRTNDYHVSN